MTQALLNFQFRRLFPVLVLLLSLTTLGLHGQLPVGLNSPKIKWHQIETDQYQVIFPVGRAAEAQRVSLILDHINRTDSLRIGQVKHKVPIILQNQTVVPNGFVSIGPWRSEFQLTAPQFQFAGVAPWLDLLTVHEYRHVQQLAEARRGFVGKAMYTLFGQGGWALYAGAIQPRWFLEGDAVYAETIYSQGGRGRTPHFENQYRALRLDGQQYDYEKASFWSYKDFLPSHYHLGYHLTTYARREFGDQVWDEVLDETYNKIGLHRFSKALKKVTGLTTKELYSAAMQDLDQVWQDQQAAISVVEGALVSPAKNSRYGNYRYPNVLSSQEMIVLKNSLHQINSVYRVNLETGASIKLFEPGIGLGDHLDVGGNKVVWSEYRFHPRWTNESYSIVRAYDLADGSKQKITSRSKLFAPAITSDGQFIAAAFSETDGSQGLVILEASSGKELQRYTAEAGAFISFPKWHPDDQRVFMSVRTNGGNMIRVWSKADQEVRDLTPLLTHSVDRLRPWDKYVFFGSGQTGVQNIFALNTQTTEVFQITNTTLGAFDPEVSADGKQLFYSAYTAQGYETRRLALKESTWTQSLFSEKLGANYFQPLADHGVDLSNIPLQGEEHQTKPFKHLTKGLLNVHSWYPFVTTEEVGFEALSRNIMGSLSLTGQFSYNFDERGWKTGATLSYGAFFPVIDVDAYTGERQVDNLALTTDTLSVIGYVGGWREHSIGSGFRIPLRLTHGNYFTNVSLEAKYRHYFVDYFDQFTDITRNEDFGSLDFEFNFSQVQAAALQNILPRWAQLLQVNYDRTLNGSANQGERFTVSGSLFFPGFTRNHSLFFRGAYQNEDIVDAFRFEDIFVDARGYGSGPFESIYRLSANYTLPLWYPDLALGSVAYFKRLRANVFYDYSEGKILDNDFLRRSFGVELQTDFRLIRLVDVGMGIRVGYQTDRERTFAELIISTLSF